MNTDRVDEEEFPTLAEVVGLNARRIRLQAGATLAQVAHFAKITGLKWTSGKVGDLESGRVPPNLTTLIPLAIALQYASNAPVTVADLVGSDKFVQVNERIILNSEALAKLIGNGSESYRVEVEDHAAGESVKAQLAQWEAEITEEIAKEKAGYPRLLWEVPHGLIARVYLQSGETEKKLAKELGVTEMKLRYESALLWGKSFTAERDARAGEDANAQRRGIVSRALKKQLKASIERHPADTGQEEA
ncbi:Xre family DNA-binding protein [Segniliparus rotundus DSM 44985]|uniref:Xre family DNA-binding protein n=1 Tax=Segniliparus rotundus (strain ATCC BAA-972 / CDC 1076 / CIP 108378 / DSM 44985 / JCM 13578) TaxID=640132 RepID=D6Z7E6_SEGRD|nr:Xre family DNA-binding protein [Segniliparus rotundus DSM 44985]